MAALHHLVGLKHHVVAQVVEAELAVRAVGDVGAVGFLALFGIHESVDHGHAQPHGGVQRRHPVGVAAGQIVVDGDHVHALALVGVEDHGDRRDQRLAFAGLHLGDVGVVQGHGADQLHVEGAQPQFAFRFLAGHRENFRQMPVKFGAAANVGLDLQSAGQDLFVAHGLDLRLQSVDLFDFPAVALQGVFVGIEPHGAFQ